MAKKRGLIALTFLVLIAGAAWGGVDIPATCRVKNQPPGRCGWCSLETLGRYHQLTALYQLSEKKAYRCSTSSLESTLGQLGIAYRVQPCGGYSQDILNYAVSENLGAVVGFRELYPGAGGHIVTLVDFSDSGVRVIDSNDQDGRIRDMSLARFLYWWDGFALVIEPKEPPPYSDLRARFSALPLVINPVSNLNRPLIATDSRVFTSAPTVPQR
jgi:hypothetical protein